MKIFGAGLGRFDGTRFDLGLQKQISDSKEIHQTRIIWNIGCVCILFGTPANNHNGGEYSSDTGWTC